MFQQCRRVPSIMLKRSISLNSGGFSLVELMIGITLGLIIISGVLGVFSSTVKNQSDNLKMSRLNQELRAVMDVMARDIRRAGYWGLAADATRPVGTLTPSATSGAISLTSSQPVASGPFVIFNTAPRTITGLKIISGAGSATITGYTNGSTVTGSVASTFTSTAAIPQGGWMIANPFTDAAALNDIIISGSCIQYTYDMNGDTVVDNNERFGFRYNASLSRVEMHKGGAITCPGTGDWEPLSSDGVVEVTSLTLSSADTQCINANTFGNCATGTPAKGDVLVSVREIDVTLTGRLQGDAAVTRTLTETVRVRNDRIAVAP